MGHWLRWNWYRALKSAAYLVVAVFAIVVSRGHDIVTGIVIGVFILSRGMLYTSTALIGRAARDHLIDLRESTRRMCKVFGFEAIVLATLVILSLFSRFPWIALLPGLYLPVWVFLFLKTRKDYQKQPAGEYMHEGIFD